MFNRIGTLYRKLSVVKIAELFGQIVLLLIIEPFYEIGSLTRQHEALLGVNHQIGWKPFDKINHQFGIQAFNTNKNI